MPKQRPSPSITILPSRPLPLSVPAFCIVRRLDASMKVKIKKWHAIAQWRWDTGANDPEDDGEGDVCGICRVPFEGCCPSCKMPGDDCPLIWGECTHVFHMHCLLQWIGTASSKQQCPMDRRPWVTAERKVDGR